MSDKYHIDINGKAVICPAKIQCTKKGNDGQLAPHFTGNPQQAQEWAEKENAREYGGNFGSTMKKKENTNSETSKPRRRSSGQRKLPKENIATHKKASRIGKNHDGSSTVFLEKYGRHESRDIKISKRDTNAIKNYANEGLTADQALGKDKITQGQENVLMDIMVRYGPEKKITQVLNYQN